MTRLNDLSDRDLERLSAYLDGELSPREAARLEAVLQSDPGMRSALEELRAVMQLMASLPARRAPRSFTLQPAMVRRSAAGAAYPRLQLATALATVAFALTFGLEFITGGMSMARQTSLESRAPMAPGAAAEFAAAPAEEAAPAAADAMLEPAVTGNLTGVETETAMGEASGGTPTELRDQATEAPASKEALPESTALADGSAGGASATAAPTPTCAPCASRMATQPAPAVATEAPMMALVAPEGASPAPEAESMDEAAPAEAPAPAEQEPGAPALPTHTAGVAADQNLMAATAPEAGAAELDRATIVTGEGEPTLAEALPPVGPDTYEAIPRGGETPMWWTPLRLLQIGLALSTLVLACLTVWARPQR